MCPFCYPCRRVTCVGAIAFKFGVLWCLFVPVLLCLRKDAVVNCYFAFVPFEFVTECYDLASFDYCDLLTVELFIASSDALVGVGE